MRLLSTQRCRLLSIAAVCAILVPSVRSAHGDLVKLKNGGEVRGKLRSSERDKKDGPVVVETLSGTIVAVDRKNVQFITRRSLTEEKYETQAKRIPNTVDAHGQLADWCRKHGLRSQRETHLRKILDIDPDHRETRLALGYSKYDGKWMTRDEWNRSRGLVKYKGRYITPEELELIRKSNAELEREREWYRKVRLWKTWMTSSNADRRSIGLANLNGIKDPDAVPALSRNFASESDGRMRYLYLKILSSMKGPKPVRAIVSLALYDSENEIRYAALNAISKDQHEAAMPYFIAALKNKSVLVVRRAGDGLRRVGDKRAVQPLIAALVTTHEYQVRVRDTRNTLSLGSNGSFAGGTALPPQLELALRAGQFPNGVIVNNPQLNQTIRTKVVTVSYNHQNREVLAALETITGKSFGYNERDWRLWLAASKSGTGVKSP